jgi:DNA-binding MarR family transcriptional regulator
MVVHQAGHVKDSLARDRRGRGLTDLDAPELSVLHLDLGYLALFVGMRWNELVLERLAREGHAGLRHAHGYVFQHLIAGPRTITELAELLEVSQQAASKSVAELVTLGYLEDVESKDRRARRVALSKRGRAAIEKTRALRAQYQQKLVKRHGEAEVLRAHHLLASVLDELGGLEAVRTRRIRAPR